jgi:hypothetical protein
MPTETVPTPPADPNDDAEAVTLAWHRVVLEVVVGLVRLATLVDVELPHPIPDRI